MQVEVSVTILAGPDLVTVRLPVLYALISDTSMVAEPLGPGSINVTLPVITKIKKKERCGH